MPSPSPGMTATSGRQVHPDPKAPSLPEARRVVGPGEPEDLGPALEGDVYLLVKEVAVGRAHRVVHEPRGPRHPETGKGRR
jgi:hypothetical protein